VSFAPYHKASEKNATNSAPKYPRVWIPLVLSLVQTSSALQLVSAFSVGTVLLFFQSVFTFSSQIVANVERALETRLKSKIETLLATFSHQTTATVNLLALERICVLVEEWSHGMQSLSAAYASFSTVCVVTTSNFLLLRRFVPVCPIVTTLKPFSQQWHLSAASMTLWSLLLQLFPGQPHYLVRARASHQLEDVPCYLLHNVATVLESQMKERNYVRFARVVRNLSTTPAGAKDVIREIQSLWEDVFFFGGALFASSEAVWSNWWVGHVSFALAITCPTELVPILRHITSEQECMDDGTGEWLLAALTEKFRKEWIAHQQKKETNDLLHPRDAITFTANKPRFSWWLSLIRTLVPLLRPRGVPVTVPDASCPLSGKQTRFFLIADPEIKHYKLLTFEQMADLVRIPRNAFDLCNLSPWQKQIAMI
jgi:hypothetical protein